MIQPLYLEVTATDLTRQKKVRARKVRMDSSVGEMINDVLLPRLQLPAEDSAGRPLTYHARLEREGRHLNASEIAGEALLPNDTVTLQPNVDAG